ncbi:YgaP family membrane protein [Pseudarthrobacter oxydans]|uniref:YgaP family membrane protein n=1 Tax=Pseudarthrobacter oxydans TaxID=1671 RepID=UPI003828D6ED
MTMNFVTFMRGTAGRALRIGAGIVLAVVGLAAVGGPGGVILALVGAVMIAAGTFNFCLLAPLFRADLWGRPKHANQ